MDGGDGGRIGHVRAADAATGARRTRGVVAALPDFWPELPNESRAHLAVDPLTAYLRRFGARGRLAIVDRFRAVARLTGHDPAKLEAIPWESLDHDRVARLREALLSGGSAPATVNLTLVALRGVARAARNLGLLSGEEFGRIEAVPRARGTRLPAGRAAARREITALLDICAANPGPDGVAGRRDAAVLTLLAYTGLRRSEVAGLTFANCVLGNNPRLRVRGKGDKEREVPLAPQVVAALNAWLAARGRRQGPLFARVDRNGKVLAGGLSDNAIWKIVGRRNEEAGLPHLTPHDFRRTWVGALLDEDVDLVTVQALAGHADPKTTARYDRRGAAAKNRAIGALSRAGAGVDDDAPDA
jgi:integrase